MRFRNEVQRETTIDATPDQVWAAHARVVGPRAATLQVGSGMPLAPGIHFLEPTIPLYVFEAPEPGPSALIQAGIHGDEIAGVHALQELLERNITMFEERHGTIKLPGKNAADPRIGFTPTASAEPNAARE